MDPVDRESDERTGPPGGRPVLDAATLVLNRSWIPVHVTTVRRAIGMLYRAAVVVVATDTLATHDFTGWLRQPSSVATLEWIRTPRLRIAAPEVVQLLHFDRIPTFEAPFTRRNLYQRDRLTCQYCGRRVSPANSSIDHVLPRSRGGQTCWENCVLACVRCNSRKGDRTLQEAGLRLLRPPRKPRWSPYMGLGQNQHRSSWQRFAPRSQWDFVA